MRRSFFILAFFLFAGSLGAQTALRYNLHQGDLFTIKQESVQETTRQLSEGSQLIKARLVSILDFRVLAGEQDRYLLEVTYKALEMTVSSNTEGILFHVDTEHQTGDDPQSKVFNSLLNVPITVTLNNKGNVIQVSGGDSLVNEMVDSAGTLDEAAREQLLNSIKGDFGPEALARNFEQMTFIYPGKEIKIGESWENHYSGPTGVTTHWTLAGLADGLARIEGKAAVQVNINGPEAVMALDGIRTTELTADLSSGFITSMKVTDHSRGNTTLPGWEEALIPTVIQATTTYKRI